MGKDFINCKVPSLCTIYQEVQEHAYYFKKTKWMVYNCIVVLHYLKISFWMKAFTLAHKMGKL